jgi:acetylornithine deacetylase
VKTCVELLCDLVSIPSVSTMSNLPVIDYVQKYLDPEQWRSRLHVYRDSAGVEKVNLVAFAGPGKGRSAELALVCHTDTVPFDAEWIEAVRPVVRDCRLYGRGSCDVKSVLACALAAVQGGEVAKLAHPLALVLTADEEIGCEGAKHLAGVRAFEACYMVIGEPTGLTAVHAGKGYALGEIVVHGAPAHSAFPTKGRSAIRDAARVLERLDKVSERLASESDNRFDPPFTTLNIGLISGGTAKNVIPGGCRMTVEWRPIPGQDARWAATLIEEHLARLADEFPGFNARLEVTRLDPPFGPNSAGRLTRLLESVTGRLSTTVSFGTEAAHLATLASEVVVFGPGDMVVAHKTGEFVPTSELEECTGYFRNLIKTLCGE